MGPILPLRFLFSFRLVHISSFPPTFHSFSLSSPQFSEIVEMWSSLNMIVSISCCRIVPLLHHNKMV
uniref:Uncharacterized protein n=1 Tax=Parascaris univalens TaxID=6257 RepID=A0A915A2P2_PARUN